MSTSGIELALGTVQFGLAYGVAGRSGPVPEAEVRAILREAHDLGIRMLDTAAAYGDIEERLPHLLDGQDFSIVSKIPAMPGDIQPSDVAPWAQRKIQSSVRRLGERLQGLMFHSASDLLGPCGEQLWKACERIVDVERIKLGVSCYEPETLLSLLARGMAVAIAQLPGSALDQRLISSGEQIAAVRSLELHLRSVFLQGLLLMSEEQATRKIPAAAHALRRWHQWCADRGLEPLSGALAIVKAFPGVRYCVVGVDNIAQLRAIVTQWRAVPAINAQELATLQLEVIDPRRWNIH